MSTAARRWRPTSRCAHAGIKNGELLRISAQRALSPPTLYDDVVDAAARLNRASYAAWNATAAGAMAFAGLWLCAAVWVYFLVSDALSAHRGVVIGGAVLTTVSMVAGGALVHRVFRPDRHRHGGRLAGDRAQRGPRVGARGAITGSTVLPRRARCCWCSSRCTTG